MNIIARAAIALYDASPMSPVFPTRMGAPADAEAEYLAAVAEKIISADTARTTRLPDGGAQEAMLRRFVAAPFAEAAPALLSAMDESMRALEIPREGFDLAVFTFDRDNDPHLCVAMLPYRRAVVHRIEQTDDALTTGLLAHDCVLPAPGSKAIAGFAVNLSTGDIRLRDIAVSTSAGSRPLFGEALFTMAASRSVKEAVQAVGEMIAQAAPQMTEQEIRPAVKRAMAKSIEEKGVIDVQEVASEVFRSDPEREAIIESVQRQMEQEQVEPVIPVENKRVVAHLQRVKIKTDTGVSITLPRALADDENSFAVVKGEDGTLSIIISRVLELKTE